MSLLQTKQPTMKMQHMEGDKLFANQISGKSLTCRIYKELISSAGKQSGTEEMAQWSISLDALLEKGLIRNTYMSAHRHL